MPQPARLPILLSVFLGILLGFSHPAFAVRTGTILKAGDANQAWKYTAKIQALNTLDFPLKRCAGVLIDKRVLLTAAHCLPKDSKSVFVSFGVNPQDPNRYEALTTRFVLHPDFKDLPTEAQEMAKNTATLDLDMLGISPSKKEFPVNLDYYISELKKQLSGGASEFRIEDAGVPSIPYNDLAIIFLNEDVPGPFAAIPFAKNFSPRYGQKLTGSGFGLHGITEASVDEELRITKDLKITSVVADGSLVTHLVAFSFGASNVCLGDSGGPAVIETDESHELVGIFSTLTNWCYGYSYYAAPAYSVDWIDTEAFKNLGRFLVL